ncbi:hypothetical protein GE061_009865 [Apolygus lucorum]|uniref:Uncharacterized protein n=1 Tax=Apolygus lucorum TaxID=248454 RepID=A0A6A4JJ22_APOLU|nr:hypothetical protein GE061_009865 [Apolygus lucorum]
MAPCTESTENLWAIQPGVAPASAFPPPPSTEDCEQDTSSKRLRPNKSAYPKAPPCTKSTENLWAIQPGVAPASAFPPPLSTEDCEQDTSSNRLRPNKSAYPKAPPCTKSSENLWAIQPGVAPASAFPPPLSTEDCEQDTSSKMLRPNKSAYPKAPPCTKSSENLWAIQPGVAPASAFPPPPSTEDCEQDTSSNRLRLNKSAYPKAPPCTKSTENLWAIQPGVALHQPSPHHLPLKTVNRIPPATGSGLISQPILKLLHAPSPLKTSGLCSLG